MNYNRQQQHIQTHQNFHLRYTLINQVQFYHIDTSCQLCYPPGPFTLNFRNFWNWFIVSYPAITYTSQTQTFLNNLAQGTYTSQQAAEQALYGIVTSIRYHNNPGSPEEIVQNILRTAVQTQSFQNDPLEDRLSEHLRTETSVDTEDSTENETEEPSEAESDTTNNSDNMQRPPPGNIQQQPNARDFQDLSDELYRLRQIVPQIQNLFNVYGTALNANTYAIANPPPTRNADRRNSYILWWKPRSSFLDRRIYSRL